MEFMRATLEDSGGGRAARVLSNQASGAVTSFARAEALVVVPADRIRIEDGDELEVIRIADVFGE
jgi:molybdopterin molybdotransferase